MKSFVILFFVFIATDAVSQKDSIAYSTSTPWPDGVYLSYNALKKSKPIAKDRVVNELAKDDPGFLTKTLAAEKFSFSRNGEVITLPSKEIWAYVQNNTFHLNIGGSFFRVPAFGAITYFGSYKAYNDKNRSDPANSQISKEYLFDYYSGEVDYFSIEKVEEMFKRDPEIYKEFEALNRFKKKEQVYLFIRKFNAKHPVYQLK